MFSASITTKAHNVLKILRKNNLKLCTAESCTGGLVAGLLTEIPGASDVFERGFVTYSNASKIELLTVPTFFIEEFGAVSRETAAAMAEGALLLSKANISVAITGIAGPDGGTEDKPVGTVFIATAYKGHPTLDERHLFHGSRPSIRQQAVEVVLDTLIRRVGEAD